jgi:uncharacterized membrane protein YjjP (DUF1212 family)
VTGTEVTTATDDGAEVRALLLAMGVALTMTGDAVSEIQARLRVIASAYGYERARISVFPTVLVVGLGDGSGVDLRTIDSVRQLRLDQATEVIHLAEAAERGEVAAGEGFAELRAIFEERSRFGTVAYIASHGVLTIGLAFLIHPAAVDLWVYFALGCLVGAMKAWGERFTTGGYLLPIVAAAVVSAIGFLIHGGNEAASLRLTIPPLVTFLPGALLTMATVDLAMGETVTGASRFVAGLLQLLLLGIGIIVGAELVGNPHAGPVAGAAAHTFGSWAPWAGVAIFGAGIYVHNSGPKRSLPWLLVVLFAAWGGQLVGRQVIDATLSGFVGAAAMVPIAHAVGRVRTAPPPHVMFLPAFWLLVPGTIGLIGITELVGDNSKHGSENFAAAFEGVISVALGILVGTMIVRAARILMRRGGLGRLPLRHPA